jgi:hypothetical protein
MSLDFNSADGRRIAVVGNVMQAVKAGLCSHALNWWEAEARSRAHARRTRILLLVRIYSRDTLNLDAATALVTSKS